MKRQFTFLAFAALTAGTAMAAGADLPRCEYDNYTKRWPQLKGVTLAAADDAALDAAKNSGASLVRYAVPEGMAATDVKAFVKRAEGRRLFVALGCGARAVEIADALKGSADAIYAYVLDSAADAAAVRAADARTPLAVPIREWRKTIALPNVFYATGTATNETAAARLLQLSTGARIFVPALGDPGAGALADLCLKNGWDWTYAGASIADSPDAAALEKRFKDKRIVGYVAGSIQYPDWLKSGKRYRGAGLDWQNGGERSKVIEAAVALGVNLVLMGFGGLRGWKTWNLTGGEFSSGVFTDEQLADLEQRIDRQIDALERDLDCCRRLGIKAVVVGPTYGEGYLYNAEIEATVLRTWRRIAARLKGRPEIYGYDIVNEPCDYENARCRIRYRDFMILAASAIREVDPDTTLVIEMSCHSSPAGFKSPNPYGFETPTPLPFDNVVYSPHVYQPVPFTHQGLHKRENEYLHYSYPATKAKLDANRERFPGDTLGKDSGDAENWNKDWLREQLQGIREFQLKYGARIWVGEFSVAYWADGGAEWLKDVTDLFEEYGWDYAYHAFRESHIWSLEHEGVDEFSHSKPDHDTDRMKVMKAKWALNAE